MPDSSGFAGTADIGNQAATYSTEPSKSTTGKSTKAEASAASTTATTASR